MKEKIYRGSVESPATTENPLTLWANDQYAVCQYQAGNCHCWEIDQDMHYILDDCLSFVYDFARQYYNLDDVDALVNPQDIVDTAGAWDDMDFVDALFDEHLDDFLSAGIFGFATADGAVIFDGSEFDIKDLGVVPR